MLAVETEMKLNGQRAAAKGSIEWIVGGDWHCGFAGGGGVGVFAGACRSENGEFQE